MTAFHHVFTVLCPAGRSDYDQAAVVSVAISRDSGDDQVAIEILNARVVSDPQAARDVLDIASRAGEVLDLYPVIDQQLAPATPKRVHRKTRRDPDPVHGAEASGDGEGEG